MSADQEKDGVIREIMEIVEKQPRVEQLALVEITRMVAEDENGIKLMEQAAEAGHKSFCDIFDYMFRHRRPSPTEGGAA